MKVLILFPLLIYSCKGLKYQADLGMLPSSSANSYEYLMRVNRSVCKDMDGLVGLCAKRIKSDEKLILSFEARPYAYRLQITCSQRVGFEQSYDVLEDLPMEVEVPHEGRVRSFSCSAEVFPKDRSESVSAKANVTVRVYDKDYQPRVNVLKVEHDDKGYLVFGEAARTVTMQGRHYKRKPVVRVKDDDLSKTKAFSESHLMRFNYANY